jgi:hypothetical protein
MRKRRLRLAALLTVALALALYAIVGWIRQHLDPTVGMSFDEALPTLYDNFDKIDSAPELDDGKWVQCSTEPDFLGNSRALYLTVDTKGRITSVRNEPHPRTRPPWLDRALKAIGW